MLNVLFVVGSLVPLGSMLAALFAATWLRSRPQQAPSAARARR
jgi:hypothetical protein